MPSAPISTALQKRCPRRTNPGAWIFLVGGVGLFVTLSAIAAWPTSGLDYGTCVLPAWPDLFSGALCGVATAVLFLLPVWMILPPTRRAIVQDDATLRWDRPGIPPLLVFGGTAWLLVALAVVTSALGPAEISYIPEVAMPRCEHVPDEAYRRASARRDRALATGGLVLLGGLGLAAGIRRRRRGAGVLEVDALGLRIDGTRWSLKDVVRVEVVDDVLHLARHDGEQLAIPLWGAERVLGPILARQLRERLPRDVEDRSEAARALGALQGPAREPKP